MASKEMNVRTDGTQLGLLGSLHKCTQSLHEEIEDTTKDLQKDRVDTRKELHEELSRMIQVETQTTKTPSPTDLLLFHVYPLPQTCVY
jgi:hypothetical protein